MIGEKFGSLKVMAKVQRTVLDEDRGSIWRCQCECGIIKNVRGRLLKRGDAKSCGCKRYKGHEELSSSYISYVKRNARLRGLTYEVSNEYLWKLFVSQDKRCALSGMELVLDRHYSSHEYTQTASLDRIDNGLGYVIGNVRWVHKRLNIMKGDMTDVEFFNWVKLIAENKRLTF